MSRSDDSIGIGRSGRSIVASVFMKQTISALIFLLLFAGLASAASLGASSPDEAMTNQLKAMAGTWEPVSAENNGVKASQADLAGTVWVRRTDGRWTMQRGGKTIVEWSVKAIDPRKSPKTIDLEVSAGTYRGVVYPGIYELEGDTLRICFALPDKPQRPTEFNAAKLQTVSMSCKPDLWQQAVKRAEGQHMAKG